MAITIHINCIPAGSEEYIDQLNTQMEMTYGPAEQVVCKSEDEDDEESLWDCFYYYANLSFDDIDWDFLSLTGEENEVYCLVYDHDNKVRRGFWYDEDAEWIDQETGAIEEYKSMVTN